MKQRILNAARTAFAARGYHGATMRQIASAAGCDIALVAHYFENKQGLFTAVVSKVALSVEDFQPDSSAPREQRILDAADFAITLYELEEQKDATFAIVRSVLTPMLQDDDFRGLLLPVLHRVSSTLIHTFEDAKNYATVASEFLWVMFARYVAQLEPLASMPRDEFTEYLATRLGTITDIIDDPITLAPPRIPSNDSSMRELIEAASFAAFSRGSYGGVPLRYIAQEVGCDVALIPYHFGSKSDLFINVVSKGLEGLPHFAGPDTDPNSETDHVVGCREWTNEAGLAVRALVFTAACGTAVPEKVREFVQDKLQGISLAAAESEFNCVVNAIHAAFRSVLMGVGVGKGISGLSAAAEVFAPEADSVEALNRFHVALTP